MPKVTLRPQTLGRLAPGPKGERLSYYDRDAVGLVLRVGGPEPCDRVWYFEFSFKGKSKRMRLGDLGEKVTLSERRDEVRRLRGLVSSGVDPLAARQERQRQAAAESNTFANLARAWLSSREARAWRPKTRAEFERIVSKHFIPALGDMDPTAIRKADLRRMLDAIERDPIADHVRGTARLLFAWAEENDVIAALPGFPKRRKKYEPRERVLEDDEIRRVWGVLDAGKFGLLGEAFRLMLLTAQRRGEVLGLRWSEIVEENGGPVWTIPGARTKNKRDHRVPLAADAAAVLAHVRSLTGGCEVAFPSPRSDSTPMANPQKAATRLWKLSGVVGATLHDLRRSAADGVARAGIPDLHIAFVLNHSAQREAPKVTETYVKNPRRLDGPKRLALEAWERALRRILAGEERQGEVVTITARA